MKIKQIASVTFPTRWANFRLVGFEGLYPECATRPDRVETALALVLGDIHTSAPIVRIHSQCTTGDVFHSLRCDCCDQLHLALDVIADEGAGIILYEHQEGRGIGLMEKLRAYELQDRGLDTIEANLQLGHAIDLRNYLLPVQILRLLHVTSVRLMTDNPQKINAVLSAGIGIAERISAWVPAGPHSERYLSTKREKLGHFSNTTKVLSSVAHLSSSGPSCTGSTRISAAARGTRNLCVRAPASKGMTAT